MSQWVNDIHQGDAAETLAEMPESSVHCAMTSPPYFGLRDYGVDGQIGLEDSLDEYIQNLVEVGEELRRVLRDDGSWWLNLGDSFAGSGGSGGQWTDESSGSAQYAGDAGDSYNGPLNQSSFRRKSKILVPHRVAIALEDTGWIVRSDAVWSKPNPMPDPVKDRLNEQKEFIFHLVPETEYWFDLDAIREPYAESTKQDAEGGYAWGENKYNGDSSPHSSGGINDAENSRQDFLHPNGKNPGDVFEITVKPFPDAHFAVYPPELCERPIKSSCPPKVCASCGMPYNRQTAERPVWERDPDGVGRPQLRRALEKASDAGLTEEHFRAIRAVGIQDAGQAVEVYDGAGKNDEKVEELAQEAKEVLGGYFREFTATDEVADGWEKACSCETSDTKPGIVLDPFAGAGTTCLVAKRHGRRFIGIDLNPEYVAMAQKRVGVTVDEPGRLLDDDETTLTAFTDGGKR